MPVSHQHVTQNIQQLIDQAVATKVAPAISCSVVVGGQWLPTVTAGAADSESYFDLASVTKLFTSVTALSLVASGELALNEPIGQKLPQYANSAKERVTLRHLLTHTSGLPSEWRGWLAALNEGRAFSRPELIRDLLETDLEAAPGSRFAYSCAGFNTIMALSEHVTRRPWAQLLEDRLLSLLPTGSITGSPVIEETMPTELQPQLGRGHVHGIVHDEAAWSLGGLSGNAGMFATSAGLAEFGEALRTDLAGILPEDLATEMWKDQLPRMLGENLDPADPGYGQGLGLRINQQSWMSSHSYTARGHGGFTGTSLLVDKDKGLTIALLSNRVNPSRDGNDASELRKAVADVVYSGTHDHN